LRIGCGILTESGETMIDGSQRTVKTVRIAGRAIPAVLFAAVLLVSGAAVAGANGDTHADRPAGAEASLRTSVQRLTAPQFAGRGSGTAEVAAAADTIASWFAAAGLVAGMPGGWLQEFPLSGTDLAGNELTGSTGRNVVGVLPGCGALADRYLVVGAHYDHLGRVPELAPAEGPVLPGQYFPGANDNASGVSVLLELARRAARDDGVSRRSVLFVAFAAEEVGLQGSAYLVTHPPVPLAVVDVMINFDTVGQLVDRRLYLSGVGTAAPLAGLAQEANREALVLELAQSGWSGSDHMSFTTKAVPVLFLFSGPYAQYNRSEDDWPTLAYDAMAALMQYSLRLLELLRESGETFTYVPVAPKNLRPADDADLNRNTWFGSIPDFTDKVVGYKLAGVIDNSPAAGAGLQAGDIVVRIGASSVADLGQFTQALRSHDPGEMVEVEVLRDDRPLRFTVILGDRRDR